MIVTVDTRQFDISFPKVRKAVEKAAVFTLTDSAKFANADLIKALGAQVDRPAPYTLQKSGYQATIAKFGATGDQLFSEAVIKPGQSA